MKILAVDTSAVVSSVSICEDFNIISEFNINAKLTHSQTLMPMMESALRCAALKPDDIDSFAVAVGPGSFTGLRIGISAVKGLAQSLKKPCLAVSTLEGLAYNLLGFDTIICSVMDARCNQVYNAIFNSDGNKIERLCQDRAITIEDLEAEIKNFKKNVVLVGDGANLCYNKFVNKDFIKLAPPELLYQKASSIAFAAKNSQQIQANELIPIYLRLPQAERELIKNKKLNIE